MLNSVSQKLDENSTYYPFEIIALDGLNPAQRLLSLTRAPLSRRVTAVVGADTATVDLRTVAPRLWKLDRVVKGDATTDLPTASALSYGSLYPTSLPGLAWQRDWLLKRGEMTSYWRWGDHWLGVSRRPFAATTITLIFRALPLAFTPGDVVTATSPESELGEVWHSLICDIAVALLLLREGAGEIEKAQQVLSQVLGSEMTRGMRALMRQQQLSQAGSAAQPAL